jgi:hypothetical protein
VNWSNPNEAVLRVVDALTRAHIPHAVYGGLLLAAYGEARETTDVDVAVDDATREDVRKALEAAGIATRPAFEGLVLGGVTVDRLALLGGDGDSGLNCVDLIRPRSARLRAAILSRITTATVRGARLPVVTPQDFVILKCLSDRPQDGRDAGSVLRSSAEFIDRDALRAEAALLATEHPDCDPRPHLARAERIADHPHGLDVAP